jgi:ribosomal protein S18 acetylase RimI-like enzyme
MRAPDFQHPCSVSGTCSARRLGPGQGDLPDLVTTRDAKPPKISLRKAVPADAPAVAAVFDAAVRAGWPFLGDLVNEPMFTPEEWRQLVADHQPPNVLLVAVGDGDDVVGYAAAHPDDCELFLLFVHPDHAGRGIGRVLLDAAHGALEAAGCREVFLFVHELNERALAVYAAAGYRPDGTERVSDFRGTRIRELRLVKRLQPLP